MPALPGTPKRRDRRLPDLPTLMSLPAPARESSRSNEEPTSSHSSGSSSDSHSSGSPGSSQAPPSSQSILSSGSLSPPQESSPESSRHASEVSFALPPLTRAIPLKRHSPLNPASFSNLPFPHPKPQTRPSINPLIRESYRKSTTSATSSRSRLYLNRSTTDENLFSPPASPYAPSSSVSSTLGGSSLSLLPDGKYESVLLTKDGNLIPFPSDLYLIDNEPMNDEDRTYTSNEKSFQVGNYNISVRGIGNIITLVFLITAIVALFIIYPMFSFYLYSNQNTVASNNGNSTNLNARNQLPLSSYSIDSGRHASDVLEIGASEYTVTFADEWETDGRRFGSGQDQNWISSINDDTSTTRNGYLIFGQRAHLQTRVPQCLPDGGFIDVGFFVEGIAERWHAYWSGNWSVIKANEEGNAYLTDVLQRSSVRGPVMVTLHMKFDGGVRSTVAVDHVRFYSLRTQQACADDDLHVALYLNLSEHHGANHSYSKSWPAT